MKNRNILLLSNLRNVYKNIIDYYNNIEIKFVSSTKEINFDKDITLIIIEPIKVKNEFITISPIWKDYLKEKYFDSILIVMGFSDYRGSNYIDLLKLPKSFESIIKKAKTVREKWNIPIDGLDLRVRFASYFKGHGEESIISIINKLCQSFNIAYLKLEDEDIKMDKIMSNLIHPYVAPEWKKFVKGWNKLLELYKIYSDFLPFSKDMISINRFVEKYSGLGEKIVRKASDVEKLHHELITVKDSLEMMDRTIRPEVYNEL